jgi:hypothetical protein
VIAGEFHHTEKIKTRRHKPGRRLARNQSGRNVMRVFVGIAMAVVVLAGASAVSAEDTVMWPDVNGKMVRIPIAHSYEQCRKNGKHLGYPDSDAHAWCTAHCDAAKKLCQ